MAASISSSFRRCLDEFLLVKTQPIGSHPFASFWREDVPNQFTKVLGLSERFAIQASPGQGQWTHIPWLAVMDSLITETPQKGFYPTFLFRSDMTGFYLTLNQGVTDLKKIYSSKTSEVLEIRAADFLAKIDKIPEGFSGGRIYVGASTNTDPALYDHGNILAKFYDVSEMWNDEIIIKDLLEILEVYSKLVLEEQGGSDIAELVDALPKAMTYEEGRRWRYHRRLERDGTLPKRAKEIHGYTCQVCEMNYADTYGELGQGYIEAHHLVPVATLTAATQLDPQKDFAVVCASCHRMLHRSANSSDLHSLRQIIRAKKR